MANPLYESLYGNVQKTEPGNIQNGRPNSMQDAMNSLRSNPIQMIRQAGYNVPDDIGSNPQSIVTYLIQSGQVSNPMLQRIRPMLGQMMR